MSVIQGGIETTDWQSVS